MMIKFEGWRVLPGQILLTEKEYEKFALRYQALSEKTKKEIFDEMNLVYAKIWGIKKGKDYRRSK